jgi:hypothetical protein
MDSSTFEGVLSVMACSQQLTFTASGLPRDPFVVSGNRHRISKLTRTDNRGLCCSEKLSIRSEAFPCAPMANLS